MQDDVIKVARAMRVARLVCLGLPPEHAENSLALSPLTRAELSVARDAMAATLELAAEALRARLSKAKTTQEQHAAAIIAPTADWLRQRANDVEGGDNG